VQAGSYTSLLSAHGFSCLAGFLPVQLFDPEDRGNIILQNVDFNCTALIG
jgi:hypothetical protein